MAENYKVKADYTNLRKKSQVTEKGDIYENDIMTITPLDSLFTDGQEVVYSDSNFKFSVRTDADLRKKHVKNDWLKHDDNEEWTLSDLIESPISDETKIRIKPDYTSIKDFAYYGSAVEMVHGTINHVLMYFPAEIYFSDEQVTLTDDHGNPIPELQNKYYVYNDFNINLETKYITNEQIDNPYRYMCLNAGNYDEYRNGNFVSNGCNWGFSANTAYTCGDGIIGTAKLNNDEITIYKYGDIKLYLHNGSSNFGLSYRPNNDIITEYFETIDEFESVLLNRESKPLYVAIFETPYDTETGVEYTMEPYIWPSVNNWNPDVHSGAYSTYLLGLIKLAEYHDQYDSNNLWRMMTHESIKNLDWTFFRQNEDDMEDMSKIDTSRIEPIIQIYSRQFDGLKRYIDTIKYANNVTYNQKNNLPDYGLKDVVGLAGFEPYLPIPTGKTNVVTESLYPSKMYGYSEVDANVNFMRNLKINAPYILSSKGTRHSIQSIMGLLGLVYGKDYAIDEYIAVAKGSDRCVFIDSAYTGCYPSAEDVEFINTSKDSIPINTFDDVRYEGIACKPISVYNTNGNIKYRYVIPWYENGKQYDNKLYFQENGGWGYHHIDVKDLNIQGIKVTASFSGFSETETRMKFATNLIDLASFLPNSVKEKDICYVENIDSILDIYMSGGTPLAKYQGQYSHYFILEDINNITIIGELNQDKKGWVNIPLQEIIEASSDNGIRVLYFETINESTIANNPHVAKNVDYDNGESYIKKFDKIFVNKDNFTSFSDNDIIKIVGEDGQGSDFFSFGIGKKMKNNRKADYFKPTSLSDLCEVEVSGSSTLPDVSEHTEGLNNPENGSEYEVPASYSVVNLKNMVIRILKKPEGLFGDNTENLEKWKDYVNNVVIEYVKQVLPSTSIFTWRFVDTLKNEVFVDLDGILEQYEETQKVLVNLDGTLIQK